MRCCDAANCPRSVNVSLLSAHTACQFPLPYQHTHIPPSYHMPTSILFVILSSPHNRLRSLVRPPCLPYHHRPLVIYLGLLAAPTLSSYDKLIV